MLKIQEVSLLITLKIVFSLTSIKLDEEKLVAEEISRITFEHIRVHCSATRIATGLVLTQKLPR